MDWNKQENAQIGKAERPDPTADGPIALETRENWSIRFGRDAPIEVEIGFGYGNFLLNYAQQRPEIEIVGMEIKRALSLHVAQRIDRLGISNAVVFRGDARRLLPALFAPHSVEAFHIQFPDPWWKKRHYRRRLVDTPFVTLIHRLLVPKGRVYLRTDVEAYGHAMVESFEDETHRFKNLEGPAVFSPRDPLDLPSNREKRYMEAGTPLYYLTYERH